MNLLVWTLGVPLVTGAVAAHGAGRAASPLSAHLVRADALRPPRGGASRAPHGYLPLHARALAPQLLRRLGLVPEAGRGHVALDLAERLSGRGYVKGNSGPRRGGL